jgi:putative nucleotidyltransferase with HDIG domain
VKDSRYAAIILAGGLSTRMKQFKPLLHLGEATVTDHIIATFLSAGVAVLLVVGYRQDEIRAGIKKQDITIVYNPAYEKGMFSTIQAGIRRLQPIHQAFFILPVDIPLVRPVTIRRLIEAATENPDNIVYPVFGGRRGHPPLIPAGLIPAILGWGKKGGLKAVLKSQEKLALEVPVADSHILFDIDTPDDYRLLLERYRRNEVPTDEECHEILTTICKVAPDRVRHSLKVAEVAVAIGRALNASGSKVDVEVVRMAAMLHDIAKGQRKHDIAGGKILRELGFGKVGDIVAVHSDLAGGNTALPLEAKIVYLADKFVGGENLVSIKERYNHPDWAPEIRKLSLERRNVALNVKKELENLLGCPLEKVISG